MDLELKIYEATTADAGLYTCQITLEQDGSTVAVAGEAIELKISGKHILTVMKLPQGFCNKEVFVIFG